MHAGNPYLAPYMGRARARGDASDHAPAESVRSLSMLHDTAYVGTSGSSQLGLDKPPTHSLIFFRAITEKRS